MSDPEISERIRYENPEPAIARVVLACPKTRNAQDHRMLYELDRGFERAMRDPEVKVVIAMRHVGHAHHRHEHGVPVDPRGVKTIRREAKAAKA